VEEIQEDHDTGSNWGGGYPLPIPHTLELSDDYKDVIAKVRKVVKMLRKSPTKNNAVLQKYVPGTSRAWQRPKFDVGLSHTLEQFVGDAKPISAVSQ